MREFESGKMIYAGEMFFALAHQVKGFIEVYFGFFDGSSTHLGSKVWSLCGWIGEQEAFAQFDTKWNLILDKKEWRRRPSELHTYDCVHGYGEFYDWPFAERLAILGELATLLGNCDLQALGSIVIPGDLRLLDADELALLESQALGNPLDLSLQYVLQQTIRKTKQFSENEEVAIIFDEEPDHLAQRYLAFSNRYRSEFGNILTGIGFGDSREFSPLQAADMLAYSTYRLEMERRFSEREGDFPVIPAFMRLLSTVEADGGGYDLKSLKKLAVVVKTHPAGNFEV
jgi:hypothetical protein